MRRDVLFCLVTLACVMLTTVAGDGGAGGGMSCSSCGSECQEACGTRHFRACCFNFQRRRRGDFAFEKAPVTDGDGVQDGDATDAEPSQGLLASLLHEDGAPGSVDIEDPWARVRGLLSFLSYQGSPTMYPGYKRRPIPLRSQVLSHSRSY
ncbi:hypothetical protein FHG87_019089 [Trinorchestia longiramus]|nr:hypothetical protein FHG87_019089 [Trinorchestia longiramus]